MPDRAACPAGRSRATLTDRLVESCLRILPERVAPDAIAAARRCLIDSLAAAYAAYGDPPIAILLGQSVHAERGGESTVIGYGHRAHPADAALVNGTMIALQQFDDGHEQMRGHPSAPLLPAVLALGETEGITVLEALRAFVVGYEVECRLGLLLNPSQYETGWHATATQGALAATVASGLVLQLNHGEMTHALGIAASMTSGIRRNFGTMTMSLHSGLAASNGVRAARLAAGGFTADPQIFDGTGSLGEVFSREWSATALGSSLEGWGDPFAIVSPGPTFRLCPCGRPTLFGVDCVLHLRHEHAVLAAEVRRIVCDVSYMYPRTLIHCRPVDGLQAKTSLQYCVAATLLDGRPTLASFDDASVRRPEIAALMQATEVRVPPELSESVSEVRSKPFEQPVTVTVETRDGRRLSATVRHHKGTPANPATDTELRQKFANCAGPHLAADRIASILEYVDRDGATLRELLDMLKVS